MLKSFLSEIKDRRRKRGQRYESGYILLFPVFAIPGGAVSYRKIYTFIKGHYDELCEESGIRRKKIPAYTTVRNIIKGLPASDSEECFRKYTPKLSGDRKENSFTACDGKTLRGSSDNFRDKKAIMVFSAFLSESGIISAHCEIGEKTDEIPAAQQMTGESGSEKCIFAYDAINCREKTLKAAEKSNNDVTVCVKGNRKILLNNCRDTCGQSEEPAVKERNRTESRKVTVSEDMPVTDKKNGNMSV